MVQTTSFAESKLAQKLREVETEKQKKQREGEEILGTRKSRSSGGGNRSSTSTSTSSPSSSSSPPPEVIKSSPDISRQTQEQQREQFLARKELEERGISKEELRNIGESSVSQRFEFVQGRSVPVISKTLKRNVGESEASYRARAESLGRGVSKSQPSETKRFLKPIQTEQEQPTTKPEDTTKTKIATELIKIGTPSILGIGALGLKPYVPKKVVETESKFVKGTASFFLTKPEKNIQGTIASVDISSPKKAGKSFVDVSKSVLAQPFVSVKNMFGEAKAESLQIESTKTYKGISRIQTGFGSSALGIGTFGVKPSEPIVTPSVVFGVGEKIIPDTVGGAVLVSQIPYFAKPVRAGFGAGITALETRNILSGKTTLQEKKESVLLGGLAGTGTFFETLPYIRGVKYRTVNRLKGEYKPVRVQEEGFKAVEGRRIDVIKLEKYTGQGRKLSSVEVERLPIKVSRNEEIGLIPKGSPLKSGETIDVQLPSTSPLKRGGFGVKQSEKVLFTDREQQLATSQIGFFKKREEIKLEREFFTTPEEPFLRIPETRESRLGIESPFETPKKVRVEFGLPLKSQIGITTARVGRTETPTQFRIGTGSELEAIKSSGTIQDVTRTGVTSIKGQGVEIFSFKIGKGTRTGTTRIETGSLTTEPSTRVSGEVVFASGTLGQTKTKDTVSLSQPTISISSPSISSTLPSRTISITSGLSGTSPLPSLPTTPPSKTISISTPTRSISTPISSISQPTISRSLSQRATRSSPEPTYRTPKFKLKPAPKLKPSSLFGVEVRRGGIFRPVGRGTLSQALTIGKGITSRTLGATFRLTPITKGQQIGSVRTPKGYYQKGTFTFIEKPKFRLSTIGETIEIQTAKKKRKTK